MGTVIQYKRANSARWAQVNPVLRAGEPGLELDTNRVKYGDGTKRWNDLPYSGSGDGGSTVDLTSHINSTSPHPVYDDMESLVGLYENAKV